MQGNDELLEKPRGASCVCLKKKKKKKKKRNAIYRHVTRKSTDLSRMTEVT